MARRKKEGAEAPTQLELAPSKSPAVFLFFWLAVPMLLMVGYAMFLRGYIKL